MYLVLVLSLVHSQYMQLQNWDCRGQPPPNPFETVEYEVVKLDAKSAANASQQAMEIARRNLENRLCQGLSCPDIKAGVTLYLYGQNTESVCAIAVVEKKRVDEFKQKIKLQEQYIKIEIDKYLAELGSLVIRSKGGRLNVFIDKVVDDGGAGGLRARWLLLHIRERLNKSRKFRVFEMQKNELVKKASSRIHAVLGAELVSKSQEFTSGAEIFLTSRSWSGQSQTPSHSFWIPEYVMPPRALSALPRLGNEIDNNSILSARIDAPAPGTLCAGESTRLAIRSGANKYIRVFSLFGKDRAILVYPHERLPDEKRNGLIFKDKIVELLLDIHPLEDDVEGFLVVASDSEEELGVFRNGFDRQCRLNASQARMVWSPARLPAHFVKVMDSYRVVRGDKKCERFQALKPEQVESMLEQLPECGGDTVFSSEMP